MRGFITEGLRELVLIVRLAAVSSEESVFLVLKPCQMLSWCPIIVEGIS